MTNPLAGDENRQLDVKLYLAHLEGRRMAMAHQVADQPAVFLHPLGASAVGDASRLDDRCIVTHVVDDANEAMIENRQRRVEDFLQRRHARTPCCVGLGTQPLYLILLFRGQGHPATPGESLFGPKLNVGPWSRRTSFVFASDI